MPRSFLAAALFLVVIAASSWGAEPLHVQIDRLIEQRAGDMPLSETTTDAEFVRRVYLDLAGRIPTVAETKTFLADASPGKREHLIDRLLSGPDYPRRMRELFHVMLLERRGDDPEWLKFLDHAFRENLPWDEMARAIIHPDADNESLRGAAYFYTVRLVSEGAMAPVDVPGLTRDAGRLLAGVDLQCAQCHDHLTVDDYRQQDFQGLHMIFENVAVRSDVPFPAVSEKLLTTPKEFMSVFDQEPMSTAPRVPGGSEIEIALYPAGEEYVIAPDKKQKIAGVPKFSPLTELALGLASGENPIFRRNIANRLWFAMMGRGLVEPLDLHHSDNPPSHPELLDLLAAELVSHRFDLKYLLREIALSAAYQRSSRAASDTIPPPESFAIGLEKPLSAEQLFWSTLQATGSPLLNSEEGSAAFDKLVENSNELKKLKKLFVSTFANPPQEPEVDFAPTVKAALFLMHDANVQALLQPRDGNLIERLAATSDENECLRELFLAIFSRMPTDDEQTEFMEYLNEQPDRTIALQHMAWAMLASTEYCLNH